VKPFVDLNVAPNDESAEAKTLRLLTLSLSKLVPVGPTHGNMPVKIQKQTHFFGNGQRKTSSTCT
jgi:hypothetical protein